MLCPMGTAHGTNAWVVLSDIPWDKPRLMNYPRDIQYPMDDPMRQASPVRHSTGCTIGHADTSHGKYFPQRVT